MFATKLATNVSGRARMIMVPRASSSDDVYTSFQSWVNDTRKTVEKRRKVQQSMLKEWIDGEIKFAQEIVDSKKTKCQKPQIVDDEDDDVYEPTVVVEPEEKKSSA